VWDFRRSWGEGGGGGQERENGALGGGGTVAPGTSAHITSLQQQQPPTAAGNTPTTGLPQTNQDSALQLQLAECKAEAARAELKRVLAQLASERVAAKEMQERGEREAKERAEQANQRVEEAGKRGAAEAKAETLALLLEAKEKQHRAVVEAKDAEQRVILEAKDAQLRQAHEHSMARIQGENTQQAELYKFVSNSNSQAFNMLTFGMGQAFRAQNSAGKLILPGKVIEHVKGVAGGAYCDAIVDGDGFGGGAPNNGVRAPPLLKQDHRNVRRRARTHALKKAGRSYEMLDDVENKGGKLEGSDDVVNPKAESGMESSSD
jgi:hypothetical protein